VEYLGNFLLIIFAYLLGSIPTGVILARAFGEVDLRKHGSGNIGAANVYRTVGKKIGIITLLGDILKGLIPVLLARSVLDSFLGVGFVALAVFLGHLYPLYLKFKGGKGIATALGAFLALSPLPALLSFIIFILVLYRWRYVSLGSLAATAAFPVLLFFFNMPKIYILFAVAIGGFIFFRHRENIRRLLEGKESKFGASRKTEPASPEGLNFV